MKTLLHKFIAVNVMLTMLPVFGADVKSQTKQKRPRYNVLFISADDLRPELGAYGVKGIKTPNVDKIAARGMRFDRAYAQYPVCNPSRASLLTGRYPTETKVINNNDYFRRIDPATVTLPQYFKNNGYVSLRSGKIFHGGIDDEVSWTEGGEPTDPNITERGNPNFRPTRPANSDPAQAQAQTAGVNIADNNSDRIIVLDGDGEDHGDYRAATRAINFIEKYKDKPFFLAVGFVKPHSPPTAPKKFFDMYDVNQDTAAGRFWHDAQSPAGSSGDLDLAAKLRPLHRPRIAPGAFSRDETSILGINQLYGRAGRPRDRRP